MDARQFMNASEFIDTLRQCAPGIEALKNEGLTDEEANEIVLSFNVEVKSNLSEDDDPLLDLIKRFDCSNIEIGMFLLRGNFENQIYGKNVGFLEVDPIFIDSETKQIVARAYDDPSRISWECASNSSSFLDAMSIAACFFARCMLDDELSENNLKKKQVADNCMFIAGGSDYKNFYYMLLGVE